MARHLKLAVLIAMTVLIAPPTRAREATWVLLGQQSVGFGVDHDTIRVGPQDGRFKRLLLEARGNDIFLFKFTVAFGNGEQQTFDIRALLRDGAQSPPFDLARDDRIINRVDLYYRSNPARRGKAVVAVYGERSLAPPAHGPSAEFEVIDTQTVDRRADRVAFRVGLKEGRFTRIRFRAPDDWMLLNGVEITFGNGQRQTLELTDLLAPGKDGKTIDLAGDTRGIQQVVVWKRPSWKPGRVQLQLLGLGQSGRPPSWGGVGGEIPKGWVLFGAQSVDFSADRDVIAVGAEVGQFEHIALRVLDNEIFLREITIVYGNGERERKVVETAIPAGRQTRPIDLEGNRFIKSIELVYQSRPGRGAEKAIVEVYGDYANDWLGDLGRRRNYNSGWVLLGAQRASMFSSDRDAIAVGQRFGRFKAVRLTARRHEVRVFGVRVVYDNGEAENLPVSAELRDGRSTPAFDLRGRGRFIERIEIKYRTKLNFKGQGVVEVWGLY